jgi:hypothetical protein
MAEGRARRERNDLKGALESFRAADALMHVTTTGLELARAQAALGQLVEARDTIRQVLRVPAKDNEPKPFADARVNAQTLDDDLAARIPGIRIVVTDAPEGTRVTVDGVAIPPEALSVPFKVNPGHHVIAASGSTGDAQQEVDVAERAVKMVTLHLPPGAAPPPVAEAPPPVAPSGTRRILMYGGFGLAGAGLAVGAVAGVMSLSATSSAKGQCIDTHCPRSAQADIDSASTSATVSTIGFIVAGAGLALGVTALVVGDGKPASAAAQVWVGPTSAGFRGSF